MTNRHCGDKVISYKLLREINYLQQIFVSGKTSLTIYSWRVEVSEKFTVDLLVFAWFNNDL